MVVRVGLRLTRTSAMLYEVSSGRAESGGSMGSSLVSRGSITLRCAAATVAALAYLAVAPAANATITSVFTNTPTPISCVTQGNGVRLCDQTTMSPTQPRSTIKTFDGVPID